VTRPKGELICQKVSRCDAPLTRWSATHAIFCDHYPLDTQNPFSYTPTTKKEVLITHKYTPWSIYPWGTWLST